MRKYILFSFISGLFLTITMLTGTVLHSVSPSVINLAWTTRVTRYIQHTVTKGDTIEKLAMMYGTTIPRILAKNAMLPDQTLVQGQKLIIPVHGYNEKLVL
jgi:LysM repeat protein